MLPPVPLSMTLAAGPAMSLVTRHFDALEPHRAGRAGRETDQRQRLVDRHAGEIGRHGEQQFAVGRLLVFHERRGHHEHVGRGAARDPGRHAVEPESVGGFLGGQDRPAEVAAAGGEVRDADGRKQFAAHEAREPALFQLVVVAAGDAAAGAGPLREDERRREAGRSERHVTADDVLGAPALSAMLRIQEPFVDAGLAAELELFGRPAAAAVDVVGARGELRTERRREPDRRVK